MSKFFNVYVLTYIFCDEIVEIDDFYEDYFVILDFDQKLVLYENIFNNCAKKACALLFFLLIEKDDDRDYFYENYKTKCKLVNSKI